MTYFHQLWEPYLAPEDVARGQLEIDQVRRIGGSERERGFIDPLNMIYAKAGFCALPEARQCLHTCYGETGRAQSQKCRVPGLLRASADRHGVAN